VWSVCLTSFTVVVLVKRNITSDRDVSPAVFLPLISVMTLGTTGGIVVNYATGISAAMAVPVIVVGYMAIGYGFFLALLYYAFLAHRLVAVGLPVPAKIPALMIAVGPMGQFATAIQELSTAANTRGLFGAYDRGVWLTASAASSVSAAAVLLALLALGFGFLWITIAWYIVVEAAVKRQLPFSLTWWSLIFPIGMSSTDSNVLTIDSLARRLRDCSAEPQHRIGFCRISRFDGRARNYFVHLILCQLGRFALAHLAGCCAWDSTAEKRGRSAGEGQKGTHGPLCRAERKYEWTCEWK
jgi:hypothetical protein